MNEYVCACECGKRWVEGGDFVHLPYRVATNDYLADDDKHYYNALAFCTIQGMKKWLTDGCSDTYTYNPSLVAGLSPNRFLDGLSCDHCSKTIDYAKAHIVHTIFENEIEKGFERKDFCSVDCLRIYIFDMEESDV